MNRLGMMVDLEPRVARDDGRRAARVGRAGHLLALVGARADRRAAQRARRHPAPAAEERRHRDGHVRARLRVAGGRRLQQAGNRPARRGCTAALNEQRGGRRRRRWTTGGGQPSPRASLAAGGRSHRPHQEVAGIDHVGFGGDFDGITASSSGSRTCRRTRSSSPSSCDAATATTTSGRSRGRNILRVMREARRQPPRGSQGSTSKSVH